MDQNNGGILGKINTPTTSVASGVWSLDSQFEAQSSSIWPLAFPRTTIANSCRFENDGSSDSFSRDMVTATSRRTFTVSMWLKKTKNGTGGEQYLFHSWQDSNNRFISSFDSSNILHIRNRTGGSNTLKFNTNQKFLDTSAWYNIIIAIDTTQSTESNRFKLYVNGTQVTSFSSSDYPSQNADMSLGTSDFDNILGIYGGGGNGFSGYMCEMVYIDGQQLLPTSFGIFNTVSNIWEPRAYAGTYGNNGFRLDFADSSDLGNDVSGNNNDFTVNNLTSLDQATDTCSNNFATFNSLIPNSNITYSQGNLDILSDSGGDNRIALSTIAVSSGKWYVEMKCVQNQDATHYGIVATDSAYSTSNSLAQMVNAFAYKMDGTVQEYNQSNIDTGEATFTTGDIIGIALDMDNNKIYFHKNGTYINSGDPAGNSNGYSITANKEYYFARAQNYATGKTSANFGSPSFSISSGNSDANGHGNFEYSVPSGYYALNTKNLAEFG
jgi:hypothetical protein